MVSQRPFRRHGASLALSVSLAVLCMSRPGFAQDASIMLDTVVVEDEAAETAATATTSEAAPQPAAAGGEDGLTSDGYVPQSLSLGTKVDTDILRVPQSVATISQEELEERNVQTLVEVGRYTAGVRTGQFGFDPRYDTLFIRGFDVSNIGYYRDGLRSLGGRFSVFRHEPYLLGGVSILKGPSSSLYGAGSPGGLVNVISKRPLETPLREFALEYGSHDHVQANVDVSGPANDSGNLFYRMTGVWRSADTEYIAARDDRIALAPALTWRSDDRATEFTLLGEFTEFTSGGAAGYLTVDGDITSIEQGDPRYRDYDGQQYRIGYEFEHALNDAITLRQNFRYQNVDADLKYVSVSGINPGGLSASRFAGRLQDTSESVAVDNQVQFDFATGPLAHTVLAGLDYTWLESDYGFASGPAPDLDLVDLNYGELPIEPVDSVPVQTHTEQSQLGVYLQDQVAFDRFTLTLGGRYDWLDTDTTAVQAGTTTQAEADEFTGRVGLTYLFDNGFAPYASYSTSFAPTTGTDALGRPFDPTTGEQSEIGLRYRPDGLNLLAEAALFRIEQSNILRTISSTPFLQEQSGEVVSEGAEASLKASLSDALDLSLAYTYVDLQFANGPQEGNTPASIPEHQASAWANYEVLGGPLKGLGIGIGVRYVGSSFETDENVSHNDDRTFVDASLSYDFGNLDERLANVSAQVNANNIFDDTPVTCANAFCYRDQGRDVIGQLRFRF